MRANLPYGQLVTPKSGKVRVVPMVNEVGLRLASLGRRPDHTGEDDPVFASTLGGRLDASALRRRYSAATRRAGLRPLPFHSLRHFFGSAAVNGATLVMVQTWMGHAHIQTTARYLHHRAQASDAALLAAAFEPVGAASVARPHAGCRGVTLPLAAALRACSRRNLCADPEALPYARDFSNP